MIPPHLQDQISQQVKDTQEQALRSAGNPPEKDAKAKPRCQFAEGKSEHCHRHSTCKWGDHWFCDEHGSRRKAEPAPPATFEAHGYTWFPHTPGHPMPCERNAKVAVLCRDNDALNADYAGYWHWDKAPYEENEEIIGWRYATPQAEAQPASPAFNDAQWALSQILDALPQRRDWLDPDLEKMARGIVGMKNPQAEPLPVEGKDDVPETIAFNRAVKGTPLERYWSAIGHAEKLERERDALRAEKAEMLAAIKEAREALTAYNQAGVGNSSDAIKQVTALNLSKTALAKLQPFLL